LPDLSGALQDRFRYGVATGLIYIVRPGKNFPDRIFYARQGV